jgi:DNA-binding GntR family transcriptional regulator
MFFCFHVNWIHVYYKLAHSPPYDEFSMLKAQTTPDLIAQELRDDIMTARILPGTALRQEELAWRFAVSRIPVREALRRLESDGLVEVFPNRGAFVTAISAAEIAEITDVRVMVEGDLIYRAVPNFTADHVAGIEAAMTAVERSTSALRWIEATRAFHDALYLPASRPRQFAVATSLSRCMERYEAIYRQRPAAQTPGHNDRAELLAACRSGSADAARQVRIRSIEQVCKHLIACLQTTSVSPQPNE